MRFLYQTYIQPNTDYGSQVWSPVKLSEIDALENILRIWTRKIPYIRDMHYWDRLDTMKMSSIQRRHERYMIIYTWQIIENKAVNNGSVKATWTKYKGRKVEIPTPKGSPHTKTLRNNAFTVRGGNLFNSCPSEIRNYTGNDCSTLGFKNLLQVYLKAIPDRPRDPIGQHWPEATTLDGKPSNSLIDWQRKLQVQIKANEWKF